MITKEDVRQLVKWLFSGNQGIIADKVLHEQSKVLHGQNRVTQ
jgi:hypothetical protein